MEDQHAEAEQRSFPEQMGNEAWLAAAQAMLSECGVQADGTQRAGFLKYLARFPQDEAAVLGPYARSSTERVSALKTLQDMTRTSDPQRRMSEAGRWLQTFSNVPDQPSPMPWPENS